MMISTKCFLNLLNIFLYTFEQIINLFKKKKRIEIYGFISVTLMFVNIFDVDGVSVIKVFLPLLLTF